ncbi:MAG: hypothetical protein FWF26_03185 [Treponema sp.]|nr:hypothetical protein [Treponema sp.]
MNFNNAKKIEHDEKLYITTCFENNTASQRKAIDEAIANSREAMILLYED